MRRWTDGPLLGATLGCMLVALAGCASPVVGAECRPGYTVCESECVDLESDRRHCGACGNACELGQACVGGVCLVGDGGFDAGRPDGALPDGALPDGDLPDGGEADATQPMSDGGEAGMPDGATPDGSAPDGSLPDGGPTDGGALDGGDAGPPVCACDIGELCCDDVCVRPDRDRNHCGGCGIVCAVDEFCAAGACEPVCEDPLTLCGELCVDTQTDPDNCGSCGTSCPTGICVDGACAGATPGHVVLIGHSYEVSRLAMRRVAGNAAFIPLDADVQVLVYEGSAARPAIRGVDQALDEAAAARGGSWTRTVAPTAADVPTLLGEAETFIVYAQDSSTDEELRQLGTDWSVALRSFLDRGGVVVVFDGDGEHAGSWQILDAAGLMSVAGRTDVSLATLEVVAITDVVATGVPTMYRGERATVRFDTAEAEVVVEHPAGPVVIHKVF